MSYDKERELVKGAYKTQSWRDKVDKMKDNQVIAIYMALKIQGKIR